MCMSTPGVPNTPARQAVKLPDNGADTRADLNAKRRRGLYASILTTPQGALGNPSVSATGGATLG